MRMRVCLPITAVLLLTLATLTTVWPLDTGEGLIVCGWDEVFILHLGTEGDPRKIWTWRASEARELPDDVKALFKTTDECKPKDNGRKVLITSSGGAVALVDRYEHRILFYGRAPNAHSADLLPRGRVAVAASVDPEGRGDRLVIFDLTLSDQALWSEELPSGHGVVWDEQRKLLWALADKDVRGYRLRDWETGQPKLDRVLKIALPEAGGHDLYPVSGTALLTVSTGNRCWLFDRDDHTFVPHPTLGDYSRVKSISLHPTTGQLVYVQAEGENWWAERLRFLNPENTLHTPGEHHYKARWIIAGE
jgi:hypothetical protein